MMTFILDNVFMIWMNTPGLFNFSQGVLTDGFYIGAAALLMDAGE